MHSGITFDEVRGQPGTGEGGRAPLLSDEVATGAGARLHAPRYDGQRTILHDTHPLRYVRKLRQSNAGVCTGASLQEPRSFLVFSAG